MGVVSAFLGLALIGLGGIIAAGRLFRLPNGWPAWLGAVVIGWAWLTLGTLGLGLAGWLTRGALLGWSALGLLAALSCLKRARPERLPDESDTAWGLETAVALGLAAWSMIVLLIPSLLLPVKVVSDGPIYHLYFAARWWQDARISLVPTPFGENAAPYFPAVGDLWLTWLFVTCGGDRLARIGQAPFLFIASATVFAIARRLGAGRPAAIMATAWFATVQPLLIFSFEPNVDTLFVAGYLLAVYFTLRYLLGDDTFGSLVLAGLAAGAAWGTKAPGVVFVPPLLLATIGGVLLRPGGWRVRVRDALIVAAVPFVLEGYWLLRNAWLTGNPLYPLHISALARTWLAGWYGPDAMPTSPYYIPRADWRACLDLFLLVFDPRQVPLWCLALVGLWSPGRRKSPAAWAVWACAGLAVVNVALYWLVIPYRTQQRFLLHAAGLAAVPLALLFDRGRWLRWAGVALLALHCLTPQVWPIPAEGGRPPWDFSPNIPNVTPATIPLFGDLAAISGVDRRRGFAQGGVSILVGIGCVASAWAVGWAARGSRLRWALPGVGFVLLIAVQGGMVESTNPDPRLVRFPNFRDYLRGWDELDRRAGKAGAKIAYAGTNLPYYLMGPDFRNKVRYINVDAHRDWRLHEYHLAAASLGLPDVWPDTRPGWDRARPDYEAWLANLRAEAIRFLVVARANPNEGRLNVADPEGFTIERVWADAHPNQFTALYADPLFKIYEVREFRSSFDGSSLDSPLLGRTATRVSPDLRGR